LAGVAGRQIAANSRKQRLNQDNAEGVRNYLRNEATIYQDRTTINPAQ
jgi:hypothetical protein